MSCWDILNIPYGSDIKTIKKAYAKLLKTNNPEDNPDGYQNLRKAYDEATKWAKKNKNKVRDRLPELNLDLDYTNEETLDDLNPIDEEPLEDLNTDLEHTNEETLDDLNPDLDYTNLNTSSETNFDKNKNNIFHNLFNDINSLLHNDDLKNNIDEWENLLDNELIWDIAYFNKISEFIFESLLNRQDIDFNIYYVLNKTFNWLESESTFYNHYDKKSVDVIMNKLRSLSILNYNAIKKLNNFQIKNYIYLYVQGFAHLKNRKYAKAKESLSCAFEIYGDSESLLLELGNLCYILDDLVNSLKYFKFLYNLDTNNMMYSLRLGNILTRLGDYQNALLYLKPFSSYKLTNAALFDLGYCYYRLGYNAESKEIITKLSNAYPKNKNLTKLLSDIDIRLCSRYFTKPMKYFDYRKSSLFSTTLNKKLLIPVAILIIIIAFNITQKGSTDNLDNQDKSTVTQNNTAPVTEKKASDDIRKAKSANHNIDTGVFKSINSDFPLSKLGCYINVSVTLENIHPTGYYKLTTSFCERMIVSQKEVDENNLQSTIESPIYSGNYSYNSVFFADKNYKEDLTNKNATYIVEGAMCQLNTSIYQNLYHHQTAKFSDCKNFIIDLLIDTSPTEIERLKKENENISFNKRDVRVKLVKSLKDFTESTFSGLHSITLKNVRPLDTYVYIDENDTVNFCAKNDTKKREYYQQAFVGELDGKNILFVDRSFSKYDLKETTEHTIESCIYEIKNKEYLKLPLDNGDILNVNHDENPPELVDIEPFILYKIRS